MRTHIIDSMGKIINTIEVPSMSFLPGLIDAAIGGNIGDSIVDGVLILAVPPATNEWLLAQLIEIDNKSIRALREGDTARLATYEQQAAVYRAQLQF